MGIATTMDKRILLQAPPTGQNAAGEPLTGWTNVVADGDGKVWAAMEDISGREFMAGAAVQTSAQTKITIRYRAGIVSAMRVLHGGDAYNIEAVLGQDRRELLLMCSRGVNDG